MESLKKKIAQNESAPAQPKSKGMSGGGWKLLMGAIST